MVGSMALIVVLSVFNGLESMVVKNFNSFNPDFVITAKQGKVFDQDSLRILKIKKIEGVATAVGVLDDVTLLTYEEKQFIAHLKGVDDGFGKTNQFDTLIIDGRYALHSGEINHIVLGAGVAYHLGVNLMSMKSVKAYYPNRLAKNLSDPLTAFNSDALLPSGVFSVQTESDLSYAIVPLRFMQELTQYDNQVTSIEVSIHPSAHSKRIQKQLATIFGDGFEVKNRYQQEELLYKVMQMEKLAVFIILSFILFLATFNIVGTIAMLIIEKKKDIDILRNMGADRKLIEKIFLAEGVLINLFGGGLGLIIGSIICILQQQFEIVTMTQSNAQYLVNAYPVEMKPLDFLLVFGIVAVTGFLSTWIPVKRILRRRA